MQPDFTSANMSDRSKPHIWESCDLERPVPYLLCLLLWVTLFGAAHMEENRSSLSRTAGEAPRSEISFGLDPQESSCNSFFMGSCCRLLCRSSLHLLRPVCASALLIPGETLCSRSLVCLCCVRLWPHHMQCGSSLPCKRVDTGQHAECQSSWQPLNCWWVLCPAWSWRRIKTLPWLACNSPCHLSMAVCVLFDFPCVTAWLGSLTTI